MADVLEEKQKLICEFFAMIRGLNGLANDAINIRDFFWKVSEISSYVPPTVEFMTILKVYRPVLFYDFRKSLIPYSSMWLLSNVNIDTGQALIRLGFTNVQQLRKAVKGINK